MTTILVTIIDDSVLDIKKITDLLSTFNNDLYKFMIHSYTTPKTCEDFDADIFILDIDMPDEDGFHFSKRIYTTHPSSKIIFFTSHNELVFDAFELNPFYYVRKEELKTDLEKAINKYFDTIDDRCYVFLTNQIPSKIPYDHIIYFQSDVNRLIISTTGSTDNYTDRRSLRSIETLDMPDSFIKVSSAFIINMKYIDSYEGTTVYFTNHTHMVIPRDNMKAFKVSWDKYLLGKDYL